MIRFAAGLSVASIGKRRKGLGTLKRLSLLIGIGLLTASLAISFHNAVAAGFFLIVGLVTSLSTFVQWQNLRSFTLSPASVSAEFKEQIDRAEEILSEIRAAETRLAYILSEQMLNKGGEHYVGGFGDEAEFNIVEALANIETLSSEPRLVDNLSKLKRGLGLKLLLAVTGSVSRREDGPTLVSYLEANPNMLPNRELHVELAQQDQLDISPASTALEAYSAFVSEGRFPSVEVRKTIYDLTNRRNPNMKWIA